MTVAATTPRSARHRWGLYLSLALIGVATLSPGHSGRAGIRPPGQDGFIVDALLNVFLFVPFGAALQPRGTSALRSLALGVLCSSAIELGQLGIPGRVASVRDIGFNVLGVLAGWTLARSAPLWMWPHPRTAGRLALAAAATASALMAAIGLLLGPAFPRTAYFGGLAHHFGHMQPYRGRVLSAAVGDLDVRSGRNPDSAALRRRLLAGERLHIQGVAGPPVTDLAPLLTIHDQHLREILLVGVDRSDLVFRYRTWAAALGLDSPEVRVPGAARRLRTGDPFTVTVAPQRRGYCVQVNESSMCHLGFTLGSGWALLLHAQAPPVWLQPGLTAMWMVGLGFPAGFWTRSVRWIAPAGGLLVISLALLPGATGLVATPVGEMLLVPLGFVLGVLVHRWLDRSRRRRTASSQPNR